MALAPGSRLGPYEILAPIGAGGMGEVYRARDSRLGRDVALKILPEAFARDTARLSRFEREARTVAGLNHPNIVTLHSIEEAGGQRFLTLELIEGETLGTLVTHGGLPLARVLDVAIPLADALVAAHGKGVVHRDLKPANVMVTRDGRIKVLDFGLAKAAHDDAPLDATQAMTVEAPLSGVGTVLGTVPYMAPEQVRGEAADARTDLFAFGIILYELAAGRRPFGGASFADTSSAILRDVPESLTRIRGDLPGDLDRIIARCLEKSPHDRFQSAVELHNELRLLRRTLERSASAPSAAEHRPSIAVLPFSNMSADVENEYFSDGLSEELLNVLAKIPELRVTGRTSSFAFKGVHEDLRSIGQKLGVGTLLEGSVRKAGNRVRITAQLIKVDDGFHLWSETYDRVLDDIFAVQDDIARAVSKALHVTLLGKSAATSKTDAESYQRLLQANHLVLQNSKSSMTRAVALYRQVTEQNPDEARAWAGLARAYVYQAYFGHTDHEEGVILGRAAMQRALELDDQLADAHEIKAIILGSAEFRWKEAGEELRKAHALSPGSAVPLTSMAFYESCMGHHDEALKVLRQAREIDPLNPQIHMQRGRIEGFIGNLKASTEAFVLVLELSPGAASAQANLGLVLEARGMHAEALAEIAKEESVGYREYARAIVFQQQGRRQESDASLALLLEQGDAWAFQLASVYAVRGEIDQAFHWLDRAYEIHDSGVPVSRVSPNLVNLHSDPRWPKFLAKIGLAQSLA